MCLVVLFLVLVLLALVRVMAPTQATHLAFACIAPCFPIETPAVLFRRTCMLSLYVYFFHTSRSDRVIDALVLVPELVRELFGLGIGVAAFAAGLLTCGHRLRALLENIRFPLCRVMRTVD